MLPKFVYVTGALDFLIGAGVWAQALGDPQPGHFVAYVTLGSFLMMAAALLMWASRDMPSRAPVVFWQGLVRISAVCSVLYGVPAGLAQPWDYAIAAFDSVVGLIYVIGVARFTGYSVSELLLCKTGSPAESV